MKKMLAAAGIGAALFGGSLAAGLAPAAQADTGSVAYLQALNNSGFTVYNTSQALSTGYQICQSLDHENGLDAARDVYNNTSYADVPTITRAQAWVIDAVFTLCPWQYHPGQGQSGPSQVT